MEGDVTSDGHTVVNREDLLAPPLPQTPPHSLFLVRAASRPPICPSTSDPLMSNPE